MKPSLLLILILSVLFIQGGVNNVSGIPLDDNPDSASQTTVFSDPQSGEIVIHNPAGKDFIVQIFDLTGKEILRREFSGDNQVRRINNSRLQRGIYLVRVTPAVSAPSVTIKVMIR